MSQGRALSGLQRSRRVALIMSATVPEHLNVGLTGTPFENVESAPSIRIGATITVCCDASMEVNLTDAADDSMLVRILDEQSRPPEQTPVAIADVCSRETICENSARSPATPFRLMVPVTRNDNAA